MKSAIPHISTTGRVLTTTTGDAYINLGDALAHEVQIINRSGTEIDVKTANSEIAVAIPNGAGLALGLSANLSEVAVRRTDGDNAQVFVSFVHLRFTN